MKIVSFEQVVITTQCTDFPGLLAELNHLLYAIFQATTNTSWKGIV